MTGNNGIAPKVKEALTAYRSFNADELRQFNFHAANLGDPELIEDLAPGSEKAIDTKRFILHTAAEALQPQPPINWIVEPVFSVGSVGLFVGEGGSKKTYSLIDCGVSVAKGEDHWLGFSLTQTPVLFVDEESGPQRFARRLGSVLRGHSVSDEIPFYYTSLSQFDLRNSGDINTLQLLISETGAGLVIIDALADVMPGADENSVRDTQPVFMQLRRLANVCNCCILLIHHSNKSGGYRGSTALKGAVELMVMVESKPESLLIDFKSDKNRDGEPLSFSAQTHFMQDQIWLTSSDLTEKEPSFNKAERYVLRSLENGNCSIKTLMDKADSCAPNSAKLAVYSLTEKRFIERKDTGGRGATAIYGLVRHDGSSCISPP